MRTSGRPIGRIRSRSVITSGRGERRAWRRTPGVTGSCHFPTDHERRRASRKAAAYFPRTSSQRKGSSCVEGRLLPASQQHSWHSWVLRRSRRRRRPTTRVLRRRGSPRSIKSATSRERRTSAIRTWSNAWGLSLSPTSPLWSVNNGTNTATLYSGGLGGASVAKVALTVTIPGGAPTGTVFNDTTGFVVSGPGGSAAASFIFASKGGDITAWNRNVSGTTAAVVAHVPGAVFKSLALAHTQFGRFYSRPISTTGGWTCSTAASTS